MTIKLFMQAIAKFLFGILSVGLLLFLPAGSVFYANGWLMMGILFVPMFFAGIVMMVHNPALLQMRLVAKEEQHEQKLLVAASGLMFIAGFVVAGLTFRFGGYMVSKSVVFIAVAVFLAAYILYAEVLRENTYLSRIIEVREGQNVLDTGLYGIVRHPMYSATLFLFLAMPLVLGSLYSFFVFLVYPFIIAKRIRYEEVFLEANLPGYSAYKRKVKYRLIPFIW